MESTTVPKIRKAFQLLEQKNTKKRIQGKNQSCLKTKLIADDKTVFFDIKPGEKILGLKGYKGSKPRDLSFLRLNSNENQYGCSPKVIQAIQRTSNKFLAQYPNVIELKTKIAEVLSVKPSQITVTNGGDEAIQLLCTTFLQDQDSLVVLEPTFSMYEFYGKRDRKSVV